jgi:Protein of unknown function (DUF1573)
MKKLFIILFAAISFTACNNADKNSAAKNTSDSTTIQWPDSTFRDFGKVKQGDVLEVSFRFVNTGSQNLVIADVKPGCGCTDPKKPDEPIAPGKEGVIKAKFNSKGQHIGENIKYITVTANTKSSPVTELSFKADVTN